jgi:hypothetical protein
VGLVDRIKRMRPQPTGAGGQALPDPAKPPGNRGEWDAAALTNVDITELVKRQIRTTTRPWQK